MFGPIKIAPSILSADFMHMADQIRELEQGGADYIHVDVMDGHFVPNLTMGVPLVKQLKKITSLPLDVHLMISNPLVQVPWFIDAGADILTVHREALDSDEQVRQCIDLIKEGGVQPALALKPDCPIEQVEPYISDLFMVLVMSVFPGFSGQSYIEGAEERVTRVCEMAESANPDLLVQVDGGVSATRTAELVAAHGADVLVAGSAVFGQPSIAQAIADIRAEAQKGQEQTLAHAMSESFAMISEALRG